MAESTVNNCTLFRSIDESDVQTLLDCLGARRCSYKKSEFIFRVGELPSSVGVVASGAINVIQEDYWGNRTILAHCPPGEIFCEAYSCAEEQSLPISVVAAEDSEVLLLDYRKIITTCSSACIFHTHLVSNMLRIIALNNIRLTKKLEYVTKKSLREKILAFLSTETAHAGSPTVTVPFDRQQLAEFLCVDRSALSRELSSMQREGLIACSKNQFTLL
ncbi:MAG: Crp/Fnr family transcriptional regulator [Coriobacteriia bacterium]|nr:Crp/Fnr family transcriptional regulator [Coriobacteriia bacterium]